MSIPHQFPALMPGLGRPDRPVPNAVPEDFLALDDLPEADSSACPAFDWRWMSRIDRPRHRLVGVGDGGGRHCGGLAEPGRPPFKPKADGCCVRDRVSSKLGVLQPRNENACLAFACFA